MAIIVMFEFIENVSLFKVMLKKYGQLGIFGNVSQMHVNCLQF